jgi:hypothetical protein
VACSVAEYVVLTVPFASENVEIDREDPIASPQPLCAVPLLASVTLTVKDAVPATAGVPEIRPEEELSVRPDGSDPLSTVQEYGAVPPLA